MMKSGFLVIVFLVNFSLTSIASESISVKDFGANGNDSIDDTKAIQKGIDYLKKKGGGSLYFPSGNYLISNQNLPGKSFALQLYSNIEMIGDGIDKSIIKLMSGQSDYTVMLSAVGVNNLKIRGLTLNGNYYDQPNPKAPSEHLHGLYLEKSSAINIDSCKFIGTGGDGVYIRMGLEKGLTTNITNCYFDDTKRNGLTLGSGFRNVRIARCYFGKKISRSPIDTEPNGGVCGDIVIENNKIETKNILTLGGVSKTNLGFNQVVRNNTLINCSIFIIYGKNILIENNSITNNSNKKAAITIIRTNQNVKIIGNKLKINNQSAISITYSANQYPSDIDISGNEIDYNVSAAPCFYIRGSDNLRIANNKVKTSSQCRLFMNITATRSMNGLSFLNNDIGNFQQNFLIAFGKNNNIKSLTLKNNKFANKRIFNQEINNEKRLLNLNLGD